MSFDTLGLSDKVVQAVQAVGYTIPTPIQEQAIPHVLQRRDVLGLAQTGTGKTASFVLPMLTLLEKGRARARMPRTLILEPTRELAAQVQENFDRYGANHKLNVALLIGGVSFDEQDKKITRGADVLIATPGRLLDHVERGRLLLTGVEILVIDEADRMLDMGFIPDIERIVKLLPFTRQTLFFSATMPPEITNLVEKFLHNPVRVEVSKPASTSDNTSQLLVPSGAKPDEKRATLRALINAAPELTNAIIFCNRKRDVATLFRSLEKHGHSVGALHGDMDQHARLATLDSFRDNRITLLVASDVAARGLDIPAVSHIFNFDVPTHSEDYVHRIGRTGRAGRAGAALTIVTKAETKYIGFIEKLIGKEIPWGEAPAGLEIVGDGDDDAPAAERRGRGARNPSRSRSEEPAAERAPRRARTPRNDEAPRTARRSRSATAEVEGTPNAEAVELSRPDPAPRRSQERARPDRTTDARPVRDRQDRPERGSSRRPERFEEPVRAHAPQRRPERRDDDDAPGGVGFADHVPAFLLRPVRIPREAEALEEV